MLVISSAQYGTFDVSHARLRKNTVSFKLRLVVKWKGTLPSLVPTNCASTSVFTALIHRRDFKYAFVLHNGGLGEANVGVNPHSTGGHRVYFKIEIAKLSQPRQWVHFFRWAVFR